MIVYDTAVLPPNQVRFLEPVRIYTGILGQIGDIEGFVKLSSPAPSTDAPIKIAAL